jgi:4,5-dihydroxyphthalate decarboxylase
MRSSNAIPARRWLCCKAFRQSRDIAFERIEGSDPQVIAYSWIAAAVAEQRELMGDNYWAYNVENNRTVLLEAMTQYAHEQGLSPARIDYMTFFDSGSGGVSRGLREFITVL